MRHVIHVSSRHGSVRQPQIKALTCNFERRDGAPEKLSVHVSAAFGGRDVDPEESGCSFSGFLSLVGMFVTSRF